MPQKFVSCATNTSVEPCMARVVVVCPVCDSNVELPHFPTINHSLTTTPEYTSGDYYSPFHKTAHRLHGRQSVCQGCGIVVSITLELANYVLHESMRRAQTEDEGLTWIGSNQLAQA